MKGWLEAREIEVREHDPQRPAGARRRRRRRRATAARPCCCTATSTSCPAHEEQFEPRVEGDRLIGRGAYDMKGGARGDDVRASRTAPSRTRARALPVRARRGGRGRRRTLDRRARARRACAADFAITGEPTDLHIGIEAKGVLAMRIEVSGRAAHGSTPWLGDSAMLKAFDVFRRIEAMEFARESSELFDRPSINLGADRGRRRLQQGARPLRDGRRHPLPARPGPRRDPRADPRAAAT